MPAIMMITGVGLSFARLPQYGLPLALAGVAYEACAFTASPQCAFVKLLSINLSVTIDEYGNLYAGPQISWGKSILPLISIGNSLGAISSGNDPHVPTETEVGDAITGFSISAGSIATGGISWSPFSDARYNTSYYMVGVPEVASVNLSYNFHLYDFSP